MEIDDFLEGMKDIQTNLLDFLENEDNDEKKLLKMNFLFEYLKSHIDQDRLNSFLRLLSNISNNHHRGPYFISRIEQLLQYFKKDIKKNFTNYEIFYLFKKNKRILLFLIKEKFIKVDKYIAMQMTSDKLISANYLEYFSKEIYQFLNEKLVTKYKLQNYLNDSLEFEKKRLIGENDDALCEIIRNDSVQEFISYINRTNTSLDISIKPSIFETNTFLIKKRNVNLIEYAAFFGSIQIFQYMLMNDVKLTQSLWLFTIHSNNAEIIHILEDNKLAPLSENYSKIALESIKCHYNNIANYILMNYLDENNTNTDSFKSKSFNCYNFAFLTKDYIESAPIYKLTKYNYFDIIEILNQRNGFLSSMETISILYSFYDILKI